MSKPRPAAEHSAEHSAVELAYDGPLAVTTIDKPRVNLFDRVRSFLADGPGKATYTGS